MANEDRFKLLVKQTLAGRVGYLCSAPRCGQSTIGPKQSERGALILGEAAHITAVSEGGPRFDRMLTSEQRRSESNGIWLCRHHARIIDVDPGNYPVEMLHEWKDRAERSQALALDPTGTEGQGCPYLTVAAHQGSLTDRSPTRGQPLTWESQGGGSPVPSQTLGPFGRAQGGGDAPPHLQHSMQGFDRTFHCEW